MKTVETNLPFPGFYYSLYDSEFDATIERDCEYFAEEWGVDVNSVSDAAFSHTDTSDAQSAIAELHAAKWLESFTDETGINLLTGHAFGGMSSPRFYNFETDRIFATVSLAAIGKCYAAQKRDGFETLSLIIRERFTSRDGFMSFYSNDLAAWQEKPLRDWDCNEICTLLCATVELLYRDGLDKFNREVEYETLEYASGNGLCDCVDWGAVERDVKEGEAGLQCEY